MAIKVGAVQLRILRVLWDEGEVPARRIGEVMSADAPINHSTVQTLLRKLEAKGLVDHVLRNRTFLFRATVPESAVSRSATQDLLTRVFHGSVTGLVAHLLDHEEISPEELSRLRALVDARMKSEENS